jgi:hypothetical protein
VDTRYNVYYAGQLLEGREHIEVRANLGKLFNADEATLDKLFSGEIQLLKRDCDEATAEKYRGAMERAGALPILRALAPDSAPPEEAAAQQPAPPLSTPQENPAAMTAAEKIAALAATEDDQRFVADNESRGPAPGDGQEQEPQKETGNEPAGLQVAPAGTDVLREDERQQPVSANIDTSALAVDAGAERLSEEPPTPPPAPDTSHMDMAAVGESIPNLPRRDAPLDPDTSGLDLADSGADVLEEQYRKRDDAQPPPTDHLSLQE